MKTTTIKKSEYEVFEFLNGYFGICKKKEHGGECIFGGDSACENHYNEKYINEVFNNWKGEVVDYDGELVIEL